MGISIKPSSFLLRRPTKKDLRASSVCKKLQKRSFFSNLKMKLQIIFLATIALIVSFQMRCEAASIYGIDLADEEVFIVRRSGYLEAGDPCSASLDCYRGLCTRGTCEVSAPGHG